MNKFAIFPLLFVPLFVSAETLNIQQGKVTYKISSDSAGKMLFNDGKTLKALGAEYDLASVSQMFVDNSEIPTEIQVVYSDADAHVTVPGNLAAVVAVGVDNSNVSITAIESVAVTVSGKSSSGQFAMKTSEPAQVTLDNLDLTNSADAAVSLTGSGMVSVILSGENSLTSGANSEKPTLRFKTPAEISGDGILTVIASASAEKAIKSNDDLTISGGRIIATVSGNALYDATATKVKSTACLASDTNILISGGTLTLTATGAGGKGISVDGNLIVSGGEIAITTSGGMAVYSGGSLNMNYTGNTDRINSDLKSSPKGIKVDGEILIKGGNISVQTSGNGGEGIESKTTLRIGDGTVFVNAYDDGINSSSHMYIDGGDITAIAKANDGLDSNGNMYISGGVVRAFGASSPECGLDANEEQGYSVIFTGGMILGVGGNNSVPSTSASTQPYLTSSISLSAGQTLTVSNGDTELATFTIPTEYSPSSGGFRPAPPMDMPPPTPAGMPPMRRAPGGWGGPGSSGGGVLVSLPSFVKSTSYKLSNGSTTSTATAK